MARWIDCSNPMRDARFRVPAHVWRIVGWCPQCHEHVSIIIETGVIEDMECR